MRRDLFQSQMIGTLLIGGSAVAYSTAGFFTKLIPLDLWTVLFWRGIFGGAFILFAMTLEHGKEVFNQFKYMRVPNVIVIALSALAMILFVSAFTLTHVSNVVIIYSTAPFIAAALSWFLYRERTRHDTLFAAVVALVGVGIMLRESLGLGNVLGDVLALLTTVALAVIIVLVRRFQNFPMAPSVCISAFVSGIIFLPLASPLSPNMLEIFYLGLFGATQLGLGLFLLVSGARLIPASQTALVGTIEIPLAPLWVWLAFDQVPLQSAFVGGGLVIAAVAFHAVMNMRKAHGEGL